MVIDHPAMVTGHQGMAATAPPPATVIVRLPATASAHRPVETIVLPAVAATARRQVAVAIVHRLEAAGLAVMGSARPRVDSKVATVRRAPKPNPQANSLQDKRRDFRGVCHSPHGHQPRPVRAYRSAARSNRLRTLTPPHNR